MTFQLPIQLDPKRCPIDDVLKDDLELVDTKDENVESVYRTALRPRTKHGLKVAQAWSNYYTTNVQFLKDSKVLYKTLRPTIREDVIEKFATHLEKFQQDTGFNNRFQFIEWKRFRYLNTYEYFLQGLSIYNFGAPLLTLIIPIFILIIPFILLRILKIPITITAYKHMVMQQLRHNAVGRLFTDFSSVDGTRKSYLLLSFAVYVFNIYQNILACIRFYKNFHLIHELFADALTYFDYVSEQMDSFVKKANKRKSYAPFLEQLRLHRQRIGQYRQEIETFRPFKISAFMKVGKKLKMFYSFKHNKDLVDTCEYSLDFMGYMDTIDGLQQNLREKKMNFGTIKTHGHTSFSGVYHPALTSCDAVKNNITLSNNYIISGPNASGKTTLLKMIAINSILTQQFHCGFYDKATIKPIHKFHCYLNIPDTSGRDSLFQAEARRCKQIIDAIEQNNDRNHLCIFDELYSGTNPHEAIGSAYAYLVCLASKPNVKFLLTTHFTKLCRSMNDKTNVKNIKMDTTIEENDVHHSYKISKGISNVRCGFQVLRQLEYPSEVLSNLASFE